MMPIISVLIQVVFSLEELMDCFIWIVKWRLPLSFIRILCYVGCGLGGQQ